MMTKERTTYRIVSNCLYLGGPFKMDERAPLVTLFTDYPANISSHASAHTVEKLMKQLKLCSEDTCLDMHPMCLENLDSEDEKKKYFVSVYAVEKCTTTFYKSDDGEVLGWEESKGYFPILGSDLQKITEIEEA